MSADLKAKDIAILGAGGTGLLIAESIRRIRNLHFVGFLDDDTEKQKWGYHDYPVLGDLNRWRELQRDVQFISSLYGAKKNADFFEVTKSLEIPQTRWATIVDTHAVVSPKATLGYGTYIGPGSVVEPEVCVGRNCALLGNVYISHHSRIADYVTCANSVSVCGGVFMGQGSFIGANATVKEYVKIGSCVVIGMGSVVLSDVADGQVAVGNPAKVVCER